MKRSLLALLLLLLHQCLFSKQKCLTIFIHGTYALEQHLTFNTIKTLWRDSLDGSAYEQSVMTLRHVNPPTFNQAMQELGLKEIKFNDAAATLFSQLYNSLATQYEPKIERQYYTFGWSGLLSIKRRLEESHILYRELKKLIRSTKQKTGKSPLIEIVGYSHGGSISLDLARLRNSTYIEDTFQIDRLILIGTPVQAVHSPYIYDSMFKNIYNICSEGDWIQGIDIFSPYWLFPRSYFKSTRSTPLPKHLTQVELQISKHASHGFLGRINYAPGHYELWSFGWAEDHYRQELPVYPLPIAIFIPYILQTIKPYEGQQKKVILHIQPDKELTHLSIYRKNQNSTIPFLSHEELYTLQMKALNWYYAHIGSYYAKNHLATTTLSK